MKSTKFILFLSVLVLFCLVQMFELVGCSSVSPSNGNSVTNVIVTTNYIISTNIIMNSSLNITNLIIHDGPDSSNWTVISLTNIIGNNYAMVLLRIDNKSTNIPCYLYFRSGDVSNIVTHQDNSLYNVYFGYDSEYVFLRTDINGSIQYKSSPNYFSVEVPTSRITIEGYIR